MSIFSEFDDDCVFYMNCNIYIINVITFKQCFYLKINNLFIMKGI